MLPSHQLASCQDTPSVMWPTIPNFAPKTLLTFLPENVAKVNFQQIDSFFYKMLKDNVKVLPKRFRLNGHTTGFCPQT